MKVIGFTCLHYGLDYLEWAIRSVIDHVDEHWVIYSPVGSHGFHTERPCPDNRSDLYTAAKRGAGEKLRWHEGTFTNEGEHRSTIHQLVPDADVILVVDADEIWGDGLAQEAIDVTTSAGFKRWRLPIIHYWRSFYRCVLHDPAFPVRVLCPTKRNYPAGTIDSAEECTFETGTNQLMINHFGYAQRPEIVEYKQYTHGHRGEWRRDVDWFQARFMANAQQDCHPVGSQYWNTEFVNPLDYLPGWMQEHPYFNRAVIE